MVFRACLVLVFMLLIRPSAAIIAYDCGHENMNITKASFLINPSCDINDTPVQQAEDDIQLLQLSEVAAVHIYQCKINVLQTVLHCGMFSHLSVVPSGISTYIADVSKETCMKIHMQNTYILPNSRILSGIKTNSSSRFSEVVAGSVDSKGNCEGVPYSFGVNSWNNVIVMHALEITITDYDSVVRLEDNQVVLRNNILCSYTKGLCTDPEYGMSFWEMIPDSSCETLRYDVLYEGSATRSQTLGTEVSIHTFYGVHTGDVVFALEIVKTIQVCNIEGYQTEHPRLVIVKKPGNEYLFHKKPTLSKNLDLFTYLNAKFVYVERHLKNQMESMYKHIMHKKCELERQVLQTQLAIAHYHPAEFALMRLQEPGFTAVPRGELIYLVKCQPVEASIRKTDRCYNELPITYNNQSYFMAPTTHLIQEHGAEIPCSLMMSPGYRLHGTWYGFNPDIHRLENPNSLSSSDGISWKYEDPTHLIKSGIYGFDSTQNLRRQIMYPSERHAIENVLTQSVMGHDTNVNHLETLNLFSSQQLDKLASYIKGTWWGLSYFGNFSASVLGVIIIIRAIKFVIGTLVNMHTIRGLHGWSWHLLAAFGNSLTTFVVHKSRQNTAHPVLSAVVVHSQPANQNLPQEVTASMCATCASPSDTPAITLDSLRNHTTLYPSLKG